VEDIGQECQHRWACRVDQVATSHDNLSRTRDSFGERVNR